MTSQEIANKWQMNRYLTPHHDGGMDNKEFYELLRKDISDYAEQEAIAFAEWLTSKDSPYSPLYGETERWCDSEREYTTAQLYEHFKQINHEKYIR